jgi:hypothetical protein
MLRHVAAPQCHVEPFGSFEEWSQRVREALIWLDCADPCATVVNLRDDDPERSALNAVLTGWEENLGLSKPYTSRDLINFVHGGATGVIMPRVDGKIRINLNRVDVRGAFRVALLDIAGYRDNIDHRRLGIWLSKHEGQILDGVRLEPKGMRHGSKTWALMIVEGG